MVIWFIKMWTLGFHFLQLYKCTKYILSYFFQIYFIVWLMIQPLVTIKKISLSFYHIPAREWGNECKEGENWICQQLFLMQLWIWERRLVLLAKMRFGCYGRFHIDLILIILRIIFNKLFNSCVFRIHFKHSTYSKIALKLVNMKQ